MLIVKDNSDMNARVLVNHAKNLQFSFDEIFTVTNYYKGKLP